MLSDQLHPAISGCRGCTIGVLSLSKAIRNADCLKSFRASSRLLCPVIALTNILRHQLSSAMQTALVSLIFVLFATCITAAPGDLYARFIRKWPVDANYIQVNVEATMWNGYEVRIQETSSGRQCDSTGTACTLWDTPDSGLGPDGGAPKTCPRSVLYANNEYRIGQCETRDIVSVVDWRYECRCRLS